VGSKVFIAIDIGTSFSGYCFKIAKEECVQKIKWRTEQGFNTPKTPTCILFDEKEKFLKFGYDAVMTYTSQTQNKEAKKLHLFENFKMELYGQVLHRDFMLTARNGKQMRAMKVFSESLRFMKDHALETIGEHTSVVKYSASDATWILTVPAIWSASAKQFMREAATEAGLVTESDPDRLIIALESEAASVWCRQLPSDGFMDGDFRGSEKIEEVPGTQYMVVDCGGGTIDITVHEVVEDSHLKELHKVSGSDMGGQTVDKNFKKFLRELISEKVFDEFEKNYPNELQRLMYDFSICKVHDGEVCLVSTSTLKHLASKENRKLPSTADAGWEDGVLHVSKEKLRSLHDDSLRSIENLIENILKKPNLNIDYILLVGGFALSPYVNSFVKKMFGGRYKVVCPADAQMAVLRGAVTFGMMPKVIESRISRYTYGIGIAKVFDETKHKSKRRYVTKEGEVFCDVLFERDQKSVRFSFFYTESKTPEFIDEPGMTKIGFGFTEMQATATEIYSGETSSVTLDFMAEEFV
uniref:Uncharacterized protein n=1 Tax=Astyanax mexicanus TaxID=7994 RepID=A0A3B1JHM5_ASTMX